MNKESKECGEATISEKVSPNGNLIDVRDAGKTAATKTETEELIELFRSIVFDVLCLVQTNGLPPSDQLGLVRYCPSKVTDWLNVPPSRALTDGERVFVGDVATIIKELAVSTIMNPKVIDQMRSATLRMIKAEAGIAKYTKGLTTNGRRKGGETIRERAEAHRGYIRKSVEDLFGNAATFDWDDSTIASFLMDPKRNLHMHKGSTRSRKTMMRYIGQIRASYKARK